MLETYKSLPLNNRPAQTVDLGYWADIRYDPDDSQPTYIGLHTIKGAATSDINWKIYYFQYSGNNIIEIQLAYGSWDNRATEF